MKSNADDKRMDDEALRRMVNASGFPFQAVMTLNVYAHVLSGQAEDAVARLEIYMAAVK